MDASLINRFREAVNEHDLILHIFQNHEGKNKWSAICSSMDWIQVAVSGIDVSMLELTNTDQASVKCVTFLSCIDLMWEAISQINRVINDTMGIPFKNDNSIFKKQIDDNSYWKEIRAAFAAHPTNLNGVNKGERRFASWSGRFGTDDFSVILYSNDPNKSDEVFNISFTEIMKFATCRYKYLEELLERIKAIMAEWCLRWKNIPIILGSDIQENIRILLNENEIRRGNDYYQYRLKEIRQAFLVEPAEFRNSVLLQAYCKELILEIRNIAYALQSMDLDYEYEEVNTSASLKYSYANKYIFEPKGMIDWAISELKAPLGEIVDFDGIQSYEELQVLVKAGWWKCNNNSDF